jgi:hypothetical protein
MALGGKHSLPGFEKSLEELREDILLMAALVRRSLSDAKTGFVQRCRSCNRPLLLVEDGTNFGGLIHFRIMTKDRTGLFCDSFVT